MFFKKKKEVEEVKEESLIEHYRHKPVHFKKPELARDEIIKSIFQRDFSMLMPKNSKGQVVAMDGAVCKCKFNGNIIPNDILEFYGSHNFIGFEACAILRQNPYIDKACTIPAQDSIAPDYKISYAENNKDEKKVDDNKLEEMKCISDKDFNIKEVCYHANVNKKTFGISLVVPVIDGVDYKKPYSIDKVKKGSYKGMVVVEPYWISPQLDSNAVSNPMNVGFQEPTWWRMPDGTVVHKSWCIKKCNSELPDILKPTYYYGGVPLTQKIYERVYAAEKVANEAPQLALTKRMLIADANIANLMENPDECQSILNLVQWCRDNFSVWFKNPDDQVSQIDTSLTDFDALVMTQYQLVASIADMPATKLLKTQPKGFNATGEYEQKDYIQSLQAIQEQDYIPILKMHYELFTKSFYGELIDLSIVFNPIDTPTEKETAEVAKIWSDIDSNYIASGVMSADEVRDIRRSEEGSAYSTLADDIEGEVTPEVEEATDIALDWLGNFDESKVSRDKGKFSKTIITPELLGEEYKGLKGQEAIDFLYKTQNGHIKNAFHREDIGEISLIWGNEKIGLKHIIERRENQKIDIKDFLKDLAEVIEKGENVRKNEDGRFEIFYNKKMAIIEPEITNGKLTFLLTAFKRRKK